MPDYNADDLVAIGKAAQALQALLDEGQPLGSVSKVDMEVCDSTFTYKIGTLTMSDGFVDVNLDGYGDER